MMTHEELKALHKRLHELEIEIQKSISDMSECGLDDIETLSSLQATFFTLKRERSLLKDKLYSYENGRGTCLITDNDIRDIIKRILEIKPILIDQKCKMIHEGLEGDDFDALVELNLQAIKSERELSILKGKLEAYKRGE